MAKFERNGGVAVVGVGSTDYSEMYGTRDEMRTQEGLGLEALKKALDDAGLQKSDIDGLLVCRIASYEKMAAMAGMRNLNVINNFEGSGRMAGVMLQYAASLIDAGLATTIALVYGNNGRSVGMKYGGGGASTYGPADNQFEQAYGMTSPGASVALMYQRYQHLYGAPDGALAPLAISNRKNAALNPEAAMRKPLTEEAYLDARYIAEPLRLFDYCMINDGGVAMILTTGDRAKHLKQTPVLVTASAGSTDVSSFYQSPDFFEGASKSVASRLYEDAGISPSDVDVVQTYDNFTPIMLFSLEHFGFAPRGRGWEWVKDGRIERDGELPVNTSGGHTSESYMQGWALQVEAVRQARGDQGARQVKDVEVSQYICVSPIITSHIFRRGEH